MINYNTKKSLIICLLIVAYFFIFVWVVSLWFESWSDLNLTGHKSNVRFYEPIALIITFICFLVIVSRVLFALLVTSVFYIMFLWINAELVRVFGSVFTQYDITHSIQLIFVFYTLMSYRFELFAVLLLIILLSVLFKKLKPNKWLKSKQVIIFPLMVLVLGVTFYYGNVTSQWIKQINGLHGKAVPKIFSEKNGFLFSFYYHLLKPEAVEKPAIYNKQKVQEIVQKYTVEQNNESLERPNVIIFFIEAFSDPIQMGINTTFDPIPNFRSLSSQFSSGMALSPELGGRSANPEFELLTGFSMRFFPSGTIPYVDSIKYPIISMPWEFKKQGYQTQAIHVASLSFFNYRFVYPLIGFDKATTLMNRPGVQYDVANRFPSENALVDEIIKSTRQSEPQFIFAFPNSTHGFWDYPQYLGSKLDIKGDFLDTGKEQLKTYINALHTADKAIGKLVRHYQNSDEKTLILIMGDHQPSLPEYRQNYILSKYSEGQDFNELFPNRKKLKRHLKSLIDEKGDLYSLSYQVPYVIWSNFDAPNYDQNLSMNMLSSRIFEAVPISSEPFFKLLDQMRFTVGEFSHKIKTKAGKYSENIPSEYSDLVNEYLMIQYDIINGSKYYNE